MIQAKIRIIDLIYYLINQKNNKLNNKINLKTKTEQDFSNNLNPIEKIIQESGIKSYRINQLLQWIFLHSEFDIDKMSNLNKETKEYFKNSLQHEPLKVINILKEEETNTSKILVETQDNLLIEIVILIDENDRKTLCLSSQIGCAMACKFCATGKVGFSRNLSDDEMLWQYLISQKMNGKIDNIVIMGMGEPLLNFDNVKKFIYSLVFNPITSFSARRITLSTSAIKGFSNKMIEINLPVKLSISLHSPFDNIRKEIMPNSLSISELINECLIYKQKTKKRITLEYILINNKTDDEKSINKLIDIAKRLSAFINLISYNEVDGIEYKSSSKEKDIISNLEKSKIAYSFRYKRGQKIKGACGQLVWERKKDNAN